MTMVDTRVAPRASRDWAAIRVVVAKDLKAVRRSKAIVLPMIIVPAVLLIVLPVPRLFDGPSVVVLVLEAL